MVVVVAIASITVARLHAVFGSHMYTPDTATPTRIVQFNPKHVLLEIFGPPGTVADINYLDEQAQPQRLDAVNLPWSFEIVTTLTAVLANVIARATATPLAAASPSTVSLRDQESADSYDAQTSCLVKSA